MKYWAPYGVSDPNAPYVNGNPATGTEGSIPPAEAIEHPQREIIDLITKEGLTPNLSDLGQLAKGIQLGKISYSIDTSGLSDVLQIAPVPIVGAYQAGYPVNVKKSNFNNTTNTPTLNVSGLGPKTILNRKGGPIAIGQLSANGIYQFIYDGTAFRLLGPSAGDCSELDIGTDQDNYVTAYCLYNARAPWFGIQGNANVTFPSGIWTTLTNMNQQAGKWLRDPGSLTTSSRFKCGAKDAGNWLLSCYMGEQVLDPSVNPSGIIYFQPQINGQFAEGSMTSYTPPAVMGVGQTTVLKLNANDILTWVAWQNTGVYHYMGNTTLIGVRLGAA